MTWSGMASPSATPHVTVKVLQVSPNLAVKADTAYNMYEVFTIKATVSVGITYVTVSAYSPFSYSGHTREVEKVRRAPSSSDH